MTCNKTAGCLIFMLVSGGQTAFSCRGVIMFSISGLCKKESGMVHVCYPFLTPPQVWGVLIDDQVYVLIHFLL